MTKCIYEGCNNEATMEFTSKIKRGNIFKPYILLICKDCHNEINRLMSE